MNKIRMWLASSGRRFCPWWGLTSGTAFIGISKPVIKAHGASNAEAIENAVGQAKQFAQSGLVADIEANIDLMRVEKE